MGFATLMLGLAPSYGFAVAARFLGGLSNGSGVAIKTMLAEAGGAQIQAKGDAFGAADLLVFAALKMWTTSRRIKLPVV